MLTKTETEQRARAALRLAPLVRWIDFASHSTSTLHAERLVETLRDAVIPWFVDSLAGMEPVVYRVPPNISAFDGWGGGTVKQAKEWRARAAADTRRRVMQQAISSVLVCLRRLKQGTDYSIVADRLLERGHVWLGEPLALWQRNMTVDGVADRYLAVELLIERAPVLPEFERWAREDADATPRWMAIDTDQHQTRADYWALAGRLGPSWP